MERNLTATVQAAIALVVLIGIAKILFAVLNFDPVVTVLTQH